MPPSQRMTLGPPLRVDLSSKCLLENPKTEWGTAELRFCRGGKPFPLYPSEFLAETPVILARLTREQSKMY